MDPIRQGADDSTEAIESLALVENYVPPGQEEPVDPILASVVSRYPISPSLRYASTHVDHIPIPLYDEVFFGCKCLRAVVRERKTHVDNSVAFLLTTPSIPLPNNLKDELMKESKCSWCFFPLYPGPSASWSKHISITSASST